MKTAFFLSLLVAATPAGARAQAPSSPRLQTNPFKAAVINEKKAIGEDCTAGLKAFYKCPIAIATGKPFHVSFGSLPPGNGIGFGAAFVYHSELTAEKDQSWSADGVVAPNRSWRAGVYRKTVQTKVDLPTSVPTGTARSSSADIQIHPYPVLDFYAQGTSLGEIAIFDSQIAGAPHHTFAERQFILGSSFVRPVKHFSALKSTVTARLNVRLSAVTDPVAEDVPRTPRRDSSFVDARFGYAIAPAFAGDRVRLNYSVRLDQFVALSEAESQFGRITGELDHEWALYGVRRTIGADNAVGPNDCANAPGNQRCPSVSVSRNQYGALHLNGFASFSGKRTPLYMQQTIGGTDVDGRQGLLAFADYRFRGTSLALVTGSFEHSIASIVGLSAIAEYGFVAAPNESLSWANRHRSLGFGVNIRLGALPVAHVIYARSSEGHRVAFLIDTTLLGGSRRPGIQ